MKTRLENQRSVNNALELLDRLKRLAPLAAWFAALHTGWKAWEAGDLLNAVLRAGSVWLIVIIALRFALSLCCRAVSAAEQAESTNGVTSK
jgi:hypothetical protein